MIHDQIHDRETLELLDILREQVVRTREQLQTRHRALPIAADRVEVAGWLDSLAYLDSQLDVAIHGYGDE